MLKTETHTPAMERRIHAAAWKMGYRQFSLFFEHGQWWLEVRRSGAQHSVVDAEERKEDAGRFIDGFDFEQVTQGDDE